MANCIVCEGPLPPRHRKICSPRCRTKRVMASEAYRQAKARNEASPKAKACKRAREESAKRPRQCAWCGTSWMVKPSRPSRYCSLRCARAAQLPAPSCPLPPWHPALRPPLALPPARVPLRRRASTGETPDRGRLCLTSAQCRWCHSFFVVVGKYAVTYCSKPCARSYAKAIRRAQMRQVEYEVISRAAVFERDSWTCHLCGVPVKRDAVAPHHPQAPTLDHVQPLARGGAHTMANLRTAHFLCNSRKGDRVPLSSNRSDQGVYGSASLA